MFVYRDESPATEETFLRDGVVGVRGFLAPREIDELKSEVARYVDTIAPDLPPEDAFYEQAGVKQTLKQLHRMEYHDPWFDALPHQAKFAQFATRLLAGAVVSQGVEWFNKPAAIGRRTPAHQDGYYFCMEPAETLTMWIALEDVDEENGCLEYVLGSHQDGLRPHGSSEVLGFSQTVSDLGPDDLRRTQPAPVKVGDLLAHHGLTIHGARANTSQRQRPSLGLVYYSARARRDESAYERYLESSREQQATARAR